MIRIILSLLIFLVAASETFAADGSRRFSNSDIKGNYGLLAQGNSVVAGTQISFPAVFVARISSDGKGNLQGMGTINPGGLISGLMPAQLVALDGEYEVDEDGTGEYTGSAAPPPPSATSNSSDPPSVLGSGALVIASSNNEIQLVSTQANRVLYITLKKQRPPFQGFSNATLRGAWGFVCHGALVTSTGDPSTATESVTAVTGLMTNDGHGGFSAEITANTNGVVTQESFTGVNSVSSDGIISATATSTDPLLAHLRGIIDNNHEFRAITTDPGTVVSCAFTAQGRRDDDRD
jgi:hypothetical protein